MFGKLFKAVVIIGGVIAIGIVVLFVSVIGNIKPSSSNSEKKSEQSSSSQASLDSTAKSIVQASSQPEVQKVEEKASPAAPSQTVAQKNAVAKAKSYISIVGFSRDGLVTQLEFDKFSEADAAYGADNSGADWNEQAAKKAKSYLDITPFSRDGLIQQLKFDKFTQSQAEYGVTAAGL